jgi:hypothetical protein
VWMRRCACRLLTGKREEDLDFTLEDNIKMHLKERGRRMWTGFFGLRVSTSNRLP